MNKAADPVANPTVAVGTVRFGNALPLAVIAGPCQLESRAHALEMASALKEIAERLGIGLVYKTSFDKANRTSAQQRARHRARRRAADLRRDPRLARRCRCSPTCTTRRNARAVAQAVDVLQIPGLPVPADRPADGSGEDRPRRQRQEGPVPRALGHGERGGQDHRRRQSQRAGDRARRLRSATIRWSPTCARCRSWRGPPGRR